MIKDLLAQLSTKVVAGALGATLAVGGLGAAGALTVPIQVISDTIGIAEDDCDDAVTTEVVEECEAPVVEDETLDTNTGDLEEEEEEERDTEDEQERETESDDEDDADESVEDAQVVAVAGALPAVPTRVSEAAKIHDFDEACGNHGKYVSHFARFGEEPPCATEAREAAAADSGDEAADATEVPAEDADAADATGESDDDATTAEAKAERKEAKAEAKAERKEAKAEAKAERKEAKTGAKAAKANSKDKGGK